MFREHAVAIWQAAVDAVRAEPLTARAVAAEPEIRTAQRVIVVGAGKAAAAMAAGVEQALADRLDAIDGIVNVPAGEHPPLRRVRLNIARPVGVNEPRPEGVAGTERMLELLAAAGPEDVAICLLSGGGSALLPAPAAGIGLDDKIAVTRLLHRCGASIEEMNCVRKHLSRVKGGQLALAFHGRRLLSLIISDVVGDPIDVIASGPTAADPTTFADAVTVLQRYGLWENVPATVRRHLEAGVQGLVPETAKAVPPAVVNRILANNRMALDAAAQHAVQLGYTLIDCGAFIEGETREAATFAAGMVRSILCDHQPCRPPACILIGGETTVTLPPEHGRGGRNQEFVLALLLRLGPEQMRAVTVLSGGTDGEDGPTDAAGALADATTWVAARERGLDPADYLRRHDSYAFWEQTGGLLRTGWTGTNVMDVRVILIADTGP